MTYNNSRHKYGISEKGSVIENLIGAGDKAPEDSNALYSSGNYNAVIPAGFTVSATESSIENGLVVIDESENEWVWIPTSSEDLLKMYVEDGTGWTMLGTSGVNTKLKTRSLTQVEETATGMILRLGSRTLARTNQGLTASPYFREPDVLSLYDTDQDYRTQAGFGDLTDMAKKLKDDYKDMIDSVKENKGFYIGRYELGKDEDNNPQVKKSGAVMNETNWYKLYSACKSFSSRNAQARMIWGCQWDQVCRYISTLGENKVSSLDNSQSYGNYNNSIKSVDKSGSNNFNNTTGRSNDWKTNNIYDLAGNCWEWTQEVYDAGRRAYRGR